MSEMKPVIEPEIIDPKQPEKPQEIVPTTELQGPYQMNRLGAFDPKKVVSEAVEIANALADVITEQALFTVIGKGDRAKKYVHLEGWSIIGGMMGVVPLEEVVESVEGGYEARVRLVRIRDEKEVGRASSICTRSEFLWKDREEYAIRSMAITRATSKAYRLSYGWIIKLAGFDPTPTEEAGQIAAVEALAAYQVREAEQMASPKERAQAVGEAKAADMRAKHENMAPAPEMAANSVPEASQAVSTDGSVLILSITGKGRPYHVEVGDKFYSVFSESVIELLREYMAKKKPVILHTKLSADGKYTNIIDVELAPIDRTKQ